MNLTTLIAMNFLHHPILYPGGNQTRHLIFKGKRKEQVRELKIKPP